MKKVSRVIIGGTLIALGCGCFLYPNFREWNTQREVESVIHKFDETYSKGIDSDITSEPVKTSDKSDSDKNDTADVTGQPANESDNKSETADDDKEKTDTGSSKNNTVTNTPNDVCTGRHDCTSDAGDAGFCRINRNQKYNRRWFFFRWRLVMWGIWKQNNDN